MKLYISRINNSTEAFIGACIRDYLQLQEHDDMDIIRNNYGKPYLANSSLKFSVSHSEDYIVGAFGYNDVGIDIEKIEDRNYMAIARRFYNSAEIDSVVNNEIELFYQLWTMKEAYSKLKGINLNIRITREEITGEGYIIQRLDIIDGYIITIISCQEEEIIIA